MNYSNEILEKAQTTNMTTIKNELELLKELESALKSYGLSEVDSLGEMSEMCYSRGPRNIELSYDVDLNDVFDGVDKINGMIVTKQSGSRNFSTPVFFYTVITF